MFNMGNMNKSFMNRFFRQVDGMVWDMMSGRVGIRADDGILTLEINEDDAEQSQITLNLFDQFGVSLPAFAQSVAVDSISVGDLIYSSSSNKVLGWVVKKNERSFRLMKKDGTVSQWNPPKVNMLGFDSGVMVLRSLMNMLPGGQSGLGQLQQSIMPMMAMGMLGDGGADLADMLPIMLMTQTGAIGGADQTQAQNPMSGMAAMMMPMMMMKMMNGSKSGNPSNPGVDHIISSVTNTNKNSNGNGWFDR